ncbi:N-acetylglucosamine kinase [Specibacter sp. RAF43]|uniref:N-acetylglucosamine kinase n=1 Tax=Specibacter sp. RAF43 TaxID=3233057 RepID=UPI003F9BBDF9
MTNTFNRRPGTIVGLDIGGSKTRGMVWVDGTVTADVTVGSANVQNVSVETARTHMGELFAHLAGRLEEAGAPLVFAGAGGIDTDDDAAALRALIAPFVPGARITVVHDTRLLLAAGGASTGVAVIAGTGSAAWGIDATGRQARAGGWGYLLGDEGSGYWLGREAVRYSLHRMDRGAAPDELTEALLDYCALAHPGELIGHFHRGTTRRYWAAAAPVVVAAAEKSHAEALRLVDQAGRDLAAMAAQVADQLGLAGPIVLGGGLGSNVAALAAAFTSHLAAAGLTEVRILDRDPIFGVPLLVDSRAV